MDEARFWKFVRLIIYDHGVAYGLHESFRAFTAHGFPQRFAVGHHNAGKPSADLKGFVEISSLNLGSVEDFLACNAESRNGDQHF